MADDLKLNMSWNNYIYICRMDDTRELTIKIPSSQPVQSDDRVLNTAQIMSPWFMGDVTPSCGCLTSKACWFWICGQALDLGEWLNGERICCLLGLLLKPTWWRDIWSHIWSACLAGESESCHHLLYLPFGNLTWQWEISICYGWMNDIQLGRFSLNRGQIMAITYTEMLRCYCYQYKL